MEPRLMVFVDGSNVINGLRRHLRLSPTQLDPFSPPDSVFQLVSSGLCHVDGPTIHLNEKTFVRRHVLTRMHWFGGYRGNEADRDRLEEVAWEADFKGSTFLKVEGDREKGVDMHLAVELLLHAQRRSMEAALVVGGDGDYVRLVEAAKSLGVQVFGTAFQEQGLNRPLRRAFDGFQPLERVFEKVLSPKTIERFVKGLPEPAPLKSRELKRQLDRIKKAAHLYRAAEQDRQRNDSLTEIGAAVSCLLEHEVSLNEESPKGGDSDER